MEKKRTAKLRFDPDLYENYVEIDEPNKLELPNLEKNYGDLNPTMEEPAVLQDDEKDLSHHEHVEVLDKASGHERKVDLAAKETQIVGSKSDDSRLHSNLDYGLNLAVDEITGDLMNKLLASRAYISLELKKELHGMKFLNETIAAVIIEFQSKGVISDCLYAESYTRSRWSSSSWGSRRFRQALLKKGIRGGDENKAIKLVFKDNDTDADHDSGTAMSKHSIDQLYVRASTQMSKFPDVSLIRAIFPHLHLEDKVIPMGWGVDTGSTTQQFTSPSPRATNDASPRRKPNDPTGVLKDLKPIRMRSRLTKYQYFIP